jgi:hypothetical protein
MEANTLKRLTFVVGMSYGMLEAGINILAGIDYEPL